MSLELGCGTGALWQGCSEAVRRCARLCLTDLSEGMLEKVRETVWEQKNVEYRIVDAIDLPYADSSFDLVFAHMMLYHVPDLGRALAEIRRVLAPDGVLWCATYGEHGIQEFLLRRRSLPSASRTASTAISPSRTGGHAAPAVFRGNALPVQGCAARH